MKPVFSVVIALAPDRSAEVLQSLKKAHYPQEKIEIVIKTGLNPSENRNKGVQEAQGEIIAFIDDDAIVDADIFKHAEQFFKDHPEIDLVGGPQLTPETDKFFAKTSGFVLTNYFGTSKMSYRYKKGKENLDADENYLTSANCFMKRKSFLKTTGFNPVLFPGEDPEFFTRIKYKGLKLAYSPDLIVYHRRRANLKGFLKQFYRYGYVRYLKERMNGNHVGMLFFAPMGFMLYVLAGLILTFTVNPWFILPIAFYFALDLLVSLGISLKRGVHRFPLLFALFFLLHMIYGLGMLNYFIKKIRI